MHKADVVVSTGASAGVGRATAQAFAKRGAKREVKTLGGTALSLPADVADAEAAEAARSR